MNVANLVESEWPSEIQDSA